MKKLILALTLLMSSTSAFANVECAGETDKLGTIVKVAVRTQGSMGAVAGARVTIELKNGPVTSYEIRAEEIPQFFESASGDPERAVVGLSAFVEDNFPVQIRYVGTNFTDNLTQILRTPGRKKIPGNEMRVWKGPGFDGSQQFSFRDVVCTVTLDI